MRLFLVLLFVCVNNYLWSQIFGSKIEFSGKMLCLDLKNKHYWGDASQGRYYGYLDSISTNLYLMKPKYNLDSLPISVTLGNESNQCKTKIILDYTNSTEGRPKYFRETSELVINDTVFLPLKNDTIHYSGKISKIFLRHNTTNDFRTADLLFDNCYDSIIIHFVVRFNYFWYWMPKYKINVRKNKVILTWRDVQFSLKKLNQREIKRILKRKIGTTQISLDWVLRFNFETEKLTPKIEH